MGTKMIAVKFLSLLLLPLFTAAVFADGNETLGPPSIMIEPGTGIAVGGTGLFVQPGIITVEVPAGATVKQVLLYWYGRGGSGGIGDDDIVIEGNDVNGILIGESTAFGVLPSQTYRADITGLGLVSAGTNNLSVSGLTFTFSNDGAGIMVIYDDGSGAADIQIRDGHDFAAKLQLANPYDRMVPQTFTFPAADVNRTATLDLFIADGEAYRPDAVEITVGADVTRMENIVNAADGNEWDTLSFQVDILAGETSVTAEVISYDDPTQILPDSIAWVAAAFALPPEPPSELTGCRVTGGGTNIFEVWNGRMANDQSENGDGVDKYTFGGQAGAPTASQPQPYGEWTHHQQSGPDGSFIFHAGTSSAPEGTEIDIVECSDPGWCVQAREAPAKQIDFAGVGTFKNIKKPSIALSNVEPGESYHWFEVHIEDLGEPGKGGKVEPPAQTCPPAGSSGQIADCNCPDFYRIKIYEAFNPETDEINKTDLIYEVYGYVDGGNLQIHPPIK